jgi:hypothetical protein
VCVVSDQLSLPPLPPLPPSQLGVETLVVVVVAETRAEVAAHRENAENTQVHPRPGLMEA